MPGDGKDNFSSNTLQLAILAFVALVPYLNILSNGFIGDDAGQILDNPYIQNFHHLRQIFTTSVWSFSGPKGATNYYRPIMTLGNLLCLKIFGASPWGFHLVSLLLNLGVAVLVFYLAKRLFGEGPVAFVSALVFALHPVHAEDVAPAAGVTELEVGFFFCLTFWFFLTAARAKGTTSGWWLAAMVFAYGLALLSKEQALILPPLALVFEHVYRPDRMESSLGQKLLRYGPLWLVAGIYLTFRVAFLGGFAPVVQYPDLTPAQTALSALALLGQYLSKLVWPVHLDAYYLFHKSTSLLEAPVLAGIFALALCAGLFLFLWRRMRLASFLVVWLLALLLPVLNPQYLADNAFGQRYLYLPSAAFAWLFGLGWSELWSRTALGSPLRNVFTGMLAALSVLGGWRIMRRNTLWHDDTTFYTRILAVAPDAYPLRLNLGAAYWNEGKFDLAAQEWEAAFRGGYTNPALWNDLGLVYMRRQDFSNAKEMFERAIREQPSYPDPHLNLGVAFERTGETSRAIAQYQEAIRLSPLNVHARNRLGLLLAAEGRVRDAEQAFRASLSIAPSVVALDGLGKVLLQSGRLPEAQQAFEQAVAMNAEDVRARMSLAQIYSASGSRAKAIEEYQTVLKLDPGNGPAAAALRDLTGQDGWPGRPSETPATGKR